MKEYESITIARPGSLVKIGGNEAIVLNVSIDASLHPRYEVAWWSAADRKTAWVDALELGNVKGKATIGFKEQA